MWDNSTSIFEELLRPFCSKTKNPAFISAGFLAARSVLVLPLCIYVLYLGYRRWRQQHSFSHSDVFTHHLSLMEMFWPLGLACYLHGSLSGNIVIKLVGTASSSFVLFAEIMLHSLICVEWYLAVVHPVTYLMFRNQRGARIRNISIGCVWLLCSGLISLQRDLRSNYTVILMFCFQAFAILAVTFCCFSVLWVLLRPGPGKGGWEKVDQSKLRSFYTITAITSVLWLWVVGFLLFYAVTKSSLLTETAGCELIAGVNWLSLPTGLVAPLLYLQRAGKLSCCYFNHE
ncbi:somatostatin receptor type 2-like [Nothobranchius furzeri]|uniref:Somatostatin receptor type 2-like n=1 Tax=Nothobranchius furzeri TaxID=105023 RepID=A0A9D3B8Z4_NOTFU|nr:somatostatin receptor type 2-like [Nothobranchius furzeri]